MSENRIRSLIRAKMEAGLLPVGPNRETYGRRGGTGNCACCGTAIGQHEVEYEVCFSSGDKLLAHMDCFRIWREEWTSINLGTSSGQSPQLRSSAVPREIT